MNIALIGNPNCGKTTLYNLLTGNSEKVGNWSGVTVDIRKAKILNKYTKDDINLIDLPGTYDLNSYSPEEKITVDYLFNNEIDLIINLIDIQNINRSLYLTLDILNKGLPVLVVINKIDTINNELDYDLISKALNTKVVGISSSKGDIKTLKEHLNYHTKANLNIDDDSRTSFINDLCKRLDIKTNRINISDKLDRLFINPFSGLIIFMMIMYFVFDISLTSLGPLVADKLVYYIEKMGSLVGDMITNPLLKMLVVDGIFGGVGAVIGFLPLVMVMYFLLALLEDSGYMARVAVLMDKYFKRVGLSGKSIIPFIIGTGCSIPGIMATRTIANKQERKTTAMLVSFMPCGAKLPVIALFAGVFFKDNPFISPMMFLMGLIIIYISAYLVTRITRYKVQTKYFILELPNYKVPSIKLALQTMFKHAKDFITKAFTIILVCNTLVILMQSFTINFELVDSLNVDQSILAMISKPFSILLIPLGFGVWQLAAATITGFVAKENIVGTIAALYGISNYFNLDEFSLTGGNEEVMMVMGISKAAALAYLVFNLFTPPCFAALGALKSELNDRKWFYGGIALSFSIAYLLSFIIYQAYSLLLLKEATVGFISGMIVSSIIVITIIYLAFIKKEEGRC